MQHRQGTTEFDVLNVSGSACCSLFQMDSIVAIGLIDRARYVTHAQSNSRSRHGSDICVQRIHSKD